MKKNLKVRICAVITAAAALMTCTCPLTAVAFSADDILAQINLNRRSDMAPCAESERISDDMCCWWIDYEFAGIAITCTDKDAMIASAPAAHPITCSDGYWPLYYYLTREENDFLMQPIEGYAAEFGQYLKYQGAVLDGQQDNVCALADDFSQYQEQVYLLSAKKDDLPALAAFAADADGISVLGAVYGAAYTPGYFDDDSSMKIVYQDGSTAYGERFTGMTLEEALAKCDEVAASDENIAYAFPTGYVLETMENKSGTIDLIPIVHFSAGIFGDANQDGDLNVKDAQEVLVAAGDIRIGLTPQISAEGISAADVDGDGTLTVKDAQYILMYYANTSAEIDCSWRSLTGNPNAPAQSNLA